MLLTWLTDRFQRLLTELAVWFKMPLTWLTDSFNRLLTGLTDRFKRLLTWLTDWFRRLLTGLTGRFQRLLTRLTASRITSWAYQLVQMVTYLLSLLTTTRIIYPVY